MAQGDFTKQAEEFFINNIDELYSTENAIEYLNDKRNTMNFSFELRRFICKKFGEKTKDNKYICILKNEKEERNLKGLYYLLIQDISQLKMI